MLEGYEPLDAEEASTDDSSNTPEDIEDNEKKTDSPSLLFSQNPSTLTATPGQSTPQLHKRENRDSSRYRDGLQFKHRSSGGGGRAKAGISRTARVCPESHQPADEQKCESCEKYHHWPEGTDEEPRECWYDWQAGYQCNQSDIEGDK